MEVVNKLISVYISGPISGLPDFNYGAFHKAAALIREQGMEAINPAELHGGDTSLPREAYLREDIPSVVAADRLLLLKGWEKSIGATTEAIVFLLTHPPEAVVATEEAESGIYLEWLGDYALWPRSTTGLHSVTLPYILYHSYLTSGDAFDRELDEIRDLHAAKRADYTGDESALANYEFSSGMMGVPVVTGMFGRLCEKVFRIKSLLGTGKEPKVTDEAMTDTLRDIAIIATLMRLHLSGSPEYQNNPQ